MLIVIDCSFLASAKLWLVADVWFFLQNTQNTAFEIRQVHYERDEFCPDIFAQGFWWAKTTNITNEGSVQQNDKS